LPYYVKYLARIVFRNRIDSAMSAIPFMPSSMEIQPSNPALARRVKMPS
jgi:hypothetical protein